MKALLVFGARPNFMKIAPVYRAMRDRPGWKPTLLHTGQHFDKEMSDDFISVLELPPPDIHLGVSPGSQAGQMAEIMSKLEDVLLQERPDVTVVVGDVSSTLAAALTSATVGVAVAHVEAGLRSRDWDMPEERNRVLTDRLSQYLFTPSSDGDENALAEGIERDRIHLVGNAMIDSLDWVLPRLDTGAALERLGVAGTRFGLVTLHRASNVDSSETLSGIVSGLRSVADDLTLLFPVHPRTRGRLDEFGIDLTHPNIRILPPTSYLDFVALMTEAQLVLTDSGGIQEEAVVLGAPCLTLRENTERPITLAGGANELVGADPGRIVAAAGRRLEAGRGASRRPDLWDGRAAERIVEVFEGSTAYVTKSGRP